MGPRSMHEPSAYAERVLAVVALIPAGTVLTYADVRDHLLESGARAVGVVLAAHGHDVPWWRVVLSDGRPAPVGRDEALRRLHGEGIDVTGGRVDLDRHRWDGR